MIDKDKKIIIKKYGNRRLYSTETSTYVTLAELEALIKTGREIQVLDSKTDEDITSQILTQILVEGGTAKSIPVDFLEKLIREKKDKISSFLTKQTQNIEKGVDSALTLQQEMMELSQKMMRLGMFWPNPFGGFQQPPQQPTHPNKDEIDALRKRLAELEKKMNK